MNELENYGGLGIARTHGWVELTPTVLGEFEPSKFDCIPYLKIVDTSQGDCMVIVPLPWGYHRMTGQCPCHFMNTAWASCGDLACSLPLSQEPTIIFSPNDYRKSCLLLVRVPGSCDATCNVSMGYRLVIFQNLS